MMERIFDFCQGVLCYTPAHTTTIAEVTLGQAILLTSIVEVSAHNINSAINNRKTKELKKVV